MWNMLNSYLSQTTKECHDITIHNYVKLNLLGEGTYGKVYKCRDIKTKEYVAIKHIKKFDMDTTFREVSILQELTHENIIKLHKSLIIQDEFYIVLDFMENPLNNIDIDDYNIIRNIIKQLINGLKYLHDNKIIHRDIKPPNLLIDKNNNLKIADFGCARKLDWAILDCQRDLIETNVLMTRTVCTLWYRAPEILFKEKYSYPIDIWSAGCIFAELLLKRPLFPGDSEIDLKYRIFRTLGTPIGIFPTDKYPNWSKDDFSKIFKYTKASLGDTKLIEKMLNYEKNKRITAAEILPILEETLENKC